MDIQNAEPQVQEQPPVNEEVAPSIPAAPTPPVEEAPVEPTPEVPVEPTEAEVSPVEEPALPEDRSAFNCKPCGGEGLIGDPAGQHEFCVACNGTGKV